MRAHKIFVVIVLVKKSVAKIIFVIFSFLLSIYLQI